MPGSKWLIVAGTLTGVAALLHLATIAGGPSWYRTLGAGEKMAKAAERGDISATLITLAIAAILAIWALYAFSGAGLIGRMPLLRTGLVAISGVFLARGLLFPIFFMNRQWPNSFVIWSSLIVVTIGIAYAVGSWKAWPHLKP